MALGGSFSFMRALERAHPDIAKKIKEKSKSGSTFTKLGLAAAAGVAAKETKTNDLKIKKAPSTGNISKAPAATFGKVVSEANKKAEDPKHKATLGLAKAVVSKDKKKATSSGKSLVASAATKKKEKKPLSLGAAAINV
jgi:hypothetical protein